MIPTPKNDRTSAVTQFCLAMEDDRRAPSVRVRTAREMLAYFFPRSADGAIDRVFLHLPPEVRAPILSGWSIRGQKSALRDTDEKVREVVADALDAGDIDEMTFERGLSASTLIDWLPLANWWKFWRSGKLPLTTIQKALGAARSLALFDDAWFLENVRGRGGDLHGVDTICESLPKDQVVAWLRRIQESGDASAASLVASLGWDVILARTSQQALLFALDALAVRVGFTPAAAEDEAIESPAVDSLFDGVPAAEEEHEAKKEQEPASSDATESGVHKATLRSYRPVGAALSPVDGSLVMDRRPTTPPPPPPQPRRATGRHAAQAAPGGVAGSTRH